VSLETAVQIGFAVGVGLVGVAIVAALLERGSRELLIGLAALLGIGSAAAWASFAFDLDRDLAVAAGGLTV
jgi:hypothetical protein